MANTDPVKLAKEILERAKNKTDDITETDIILDVEDSQDAEGKKATPTPKGKKKMKDDKMSPSSASAKIDEPHMEEDVDEDEDKDEIEEESYDIDYNVKEDVDALFNGEDLSEGFRNKATTIFESAVRTRVDAVVEQLEENYETKLNTAIDESKDELSKKLDDYLGYVVEEWMKDNELALELGIKTEIAESFLSELHGLFKSHYITVPDGQDDLLEQMVNKVEELEGTLNESLERNVEIRKELNESKCSEIFVAESKGLVDTDIEKFRTLAEGVDFDTVDQYKEKLSVLRESYFGDDAGNDLTEDFDVEENTASEATPKTSTVIDAYASAISDQIKNL